MKLLERYLLQVERYLPLKDRKDTIEELKNLLLDDIEQRKADGQPSDDAEFEVIKLFGDPKKVALSYRSDNAIISREMEPLLYMILKIVIIAVPSSVLLATIISFLNNGLPFDFIDLLVAILFALPDMGSAALVAVGTVFIVFAIIERFFKPYVLEELEKEGMLEFNPKNLPKIPDSVFKVSIVESVLGVVFGLVAIYIFNYQPGIIAIYFDGESLPLLNENFNRILHVINVSIIFGITIALFHLIVRHKTMVSTTFEFMNAMLTVIIFTLLATGDVINQVVIEAYDLETLSVMFVIGMSIGAVANFISGIYTYVKVFIKRSGKEKLLKDIIEKS